jgi:hypothetical protein
MRLTECLSDLGRPVVVYPKMGRLTGGLKESVFLSQLIYWSGKQSNKEGWIYKTADELEEETGLTRREQERCRRELKRKNFILESVKGMPARLFFKVNFEAVNTAWEALLKSDSTTRTDSDDETEEISEVIPSEKISVNHGSPIGENRGTRRVTPDSPIGGTIESESTTEKTPEKPKGENFSAKNFAEATPPRPRHPGYVSKLLTLYLELYKPKVLIRAYDWGYALKQLRKLRFNGNFLETESFLRKLHEVSPDILPPEIFERSGELIKQVNCPSKHRFAGGPDKGWG